MSPRLLLAVWFILCGQASAQTNDSFAGRLPLSSGSAIALSNNLAATREAGEPIHATTSTGRSLWWTWTAPTTGVYNFGTFSGSTGALSPRAIAVYAGDLVDALSEVASTNDFISPKSLFVPGLYLNSVLEIGNSLNVAVTAGITYQIAVDARTGYDGVYVEDGTTVLAINQPPTVLVGAAMILQTGSAFQSYVFASNGANYFGATNLPPGLGINPSNGLISGTPAVKGRYAVDLAATGPGGTGTATMMMEVIDPINASLAIPVLYTEAGMRGYVGQSFYYQLSSTSGSATYTVASLPDGLTFDGPSITGTPTKPGTYQVPLTATNAAGTGIATLTITILDAPLPPFLNFPLTASTNVGSTPASSVTVDGGINAQTFTLNATGLPPGITLSSNYYGGSFSGKATQEGTYPVEITVTNAGGTRTGTLIVTVFPAVQVPVDVAPVLTNRVVASGTVGSSFTYTVAASNQPSSYTADNLPPGLTFDPATGVISGTPTTGGTFQVPVSASNAYGTATGTLTINFAIASSELPTDGFVQPLVVSAASAVGTVGKSLGHPVAATYDGSYLGIKNWSFTATGLPPGMQLIPVYPAGNAALTGTPTTAGIYRVNVTATLSGGSVPLGPIGRIPLVAKAVVTFVIRDDAATEGLPFITSRAAAGYQDGTTSVSSYDIPPPFSYTITAPNSPTVFSASGLPEGLSLNPSSGVISGYPVKDGIFQPTIRAANAAGTFEATLTITVTTALPVLASPLGAKGRVNSAFSYYLATSVRPMSGSYPTNAATLSLWSYAASGLPPGLTLNTSTGLVTGTSTRAGVYPVRIAATNRAGTSTGIVTIATSEALAPALTPPILEGDASVVGVLGQPLTTSLMGSYAQSYAASNLPPGLGLDAGTGQITGTPTATGTFAMPVSATNAAGTTRATLTVSVDARARTPYVASRLAEDAVIGKPYRAFVYAENYTGVPATTAYTASNLPAGLSFDAQIGLISGTPNGPAGTFPVPVSLTRAGLTATAILTINVVPPPAVFTPPTLSSKAGTYGLTGYSLSYTLSNLAFAPVGGLPAGLGYDPATGILSGIPAAAGTYRIPLATSAADGDRRAMLTLSVFDAAYASPRFTRQPVGETAFQNNPFILSATAAGVPQPTYQWFRNGVLLPGATAGTLTIASAQSGDAGLYRVTATNTAGSVTSDAVSVMVQPVVQQTFTIWQAAHFTNAEVAAGLAADGADPDGDGLPNLLEYALGTDPRLSSTNGLPTSGYSPASGRLRFSFTRDAARTDLAYLVEASDDLRAWTPVARSDAGASTANLGGAMVSESPVAGTSQISVAVEVGPVAGTMGRRFVRLRVTRGQ